MYKHDEEIKLILPCFSSNKNNESELLQNSKNRYQILLW